LFNTISIDVPIWKNPSFVLGFTSVGKFLSLGCQT
jgi:hypothetical protein